MAQPFHPGRLELTGQAVPVAEHVGDNGIAAGYFTVSDNGILAYRGSNARNAQLTLFDRQGKVLGMVGEPGVYSTMSLSPDGKRVAAERIDSQTRSSDLWIFELAGGGRMRFTSDGATATSPVWSPDGNRIAFASDRSGHIGIYQKASSGVVDPELLFQSPDPMIPTGWSRDGRFLLGHTLGQDHLWLLPLDQGIRQPFPLTSQFNEVGARFSSDNRWIAYRSNESGKFEIYVRPFHLSAAGSPSLGSEWMISQGGGDGVRWRADRKELFYMLPDGTVMSVEVLPTAVSGEAGFQVKVRAPLFKIPAASRSWDVTPDGKQFLMPVPVGVTDPAPFTIVLNWPAELKR
jgi:serine/threonine-protein kinase